MDEVNEKDNKELWELYQKIKDEIKNQYGKDDRSKQSYFDPILTLIEEKMKNLDVNSESYIKLLSKKASVLYENAKLLLTFQDQNEIICIELLRDALTLVHSKQLDKIVCYLYFRILNLLSYILSKIGELEEACKYLEDAEISYENIKEKNEIYLYNTDELFQNVLKANSTIKFEKLITNNFQIQAWIYNKMTLSKKFIKYHHIVLNRQLETQDGNAVMWFYKCIRLGAYFFSNNRFKEGRLHLGAACVVLREYEMDLLKRRNESYFHGEWNNLQRYYADLGKYWIKYALFLFNASRHLATSQLNGDINIHNILANSFQDQESSSRSTGEWFNRRNTLFFPDRKETTYKSPENTKENQENVNNDITDQIQNECSNEEEKEKADLLNEIHEEMNKMNEESTESEEIADLTKMVIEALDDRQKEVEIGDQICDQEKNKTTSPTDIKHTGDQNLEQIKPETNIEKELTETVKEETDAKELFNNISDSQSQSSSSKTDEDGIYECKFPSLDLSSFDLVPISLINNPTIAKEFFGYIQQEWVKRAKLYYTIQTSPHEYIHLMLDLNELYRFVIMYEKDIECQYIAQKRRVDLLELLSTMMKELRPQEYLFIGIELMQELIQAQIELLILNIRRLTHVPSSGSILLKDICQEQNDASRKMEALMEIQRRLSGRKGARMTFAETQLFD